MENKLNIYQRMLQVMTEVQSVQKEDKKVNNQYRFVSHDAVSKAVHMPMVRAGIYMQPDVLEMKQDGNRTEIMMSMTFINAEQPEDRFVLKMPGYGIDPQDKGIGKAISYATKYGYLKAFCLETGDDVEKDNIDHVPEEKFLSATQINEILQLADKYPEKLKTILVRLNAKSLQEVDSAEYERIVKYFKQIPSAKISPMTKQGVA